MSTKRRATLNDVAEKAAVSPVTVSRALRFPEMVSPRLRERIEEAVRTLNYIPNHMASALASGQTNLVGVIVPSLTNSVFNGYVSAIQEVLVPAGLQVIVSNARYSLTEEEAAIRTLLGYHPEAMIIVGVDQSELSRRLLVESGIPVIQTLDLTSDPIDINIGFSHELAGYEATRYLQALGHERIAHLTSGSDPRATRRASGYERAMHEAGIETTDLLMRTSEESTILNGAKLLAELMARETPITAVFCCNDDFALGALFESHRMNLRVPDDLSIVGFNDIDFCATASPALTSVATNRTQIGRSSANMVLEIIRGSGTRPKEQQTEVPFHIKERASVRRID